MAISTLFLIFLTFLFLPVKLAFGNNITLNSTLSTNDKNPVWLSSSGEFGFGFHQINDTNQNQNHFLLAIWYNKIPEKTIVWNANADKLAPIGSSVQLTKSGLTLSNPQGEAIWTAIPAELGTVSYGAMLDTGNFVLASTNSSSTSTYVWESFKNPTDTLLPTQNLELQGTLTSRLTENNYTKGRFQLYFDEGDLYISGIGWPVSQGDSRYTNYFSVDANESATKLVFDESEANVYVETNGHNMKISLGWDNIAIQPDAYYYRATLDYYGVFTQYSHLKNSTGQQGWSIMRYVPHDICSAVYSLLGSGSCGYNSYCSMENQRPNCKCPEGYSLVDPNNQFGGCQPDLSLGCGADDAKSQDKPEEVFQMKVVENVDFPLGDYERLVSYTLQDCQTTCLHDCMCGAAIFINGTEECFKKKLPLYNGRVRIGDGYNALIKSRILTLSSNHDPIPSSNLGENKKDSILLGSLIGSLFINSVLLVVIVVIFLSRPRKISHAPRILETNVMLSFPYEALKQYTHDFKEEIGRGSFGIVYKGALNSGSDQVPVAVKKLDRLALERETEFRTELSFIGKTCHKNLVPLIGFCDEGVHRLIVYKFMSNGTLADILFGQVKQLWDLRVRIALGIARGLVYLHEECDIPIIHCDIKPQNILIDEHFTPKISDFGLAKLLKSDQSKTRTMIRGTRGYVAPEWFKNMPVTAKVDVYSFGVMLLEIICCRKSVVLMESGEEENTILTDYAYDCYIEGRINDLVDGDNVALADKNRLTKWVMIAIWCIQEHHEMRPTMKMVINMLEGIVDVLDPPSPSSFTISS